MAVGSCLASPPLKNEQNLSLKQPRPPVIILKNKEIKFSDGAHHFSLLAILAREVLLWHGWLEPKNSMQFSPIPFLQHGTNRRKRGYTLVEVLCAIVIAAISASVLFVGFDNGFALLRTTREDLRATQILMQKTEAIRLYSWQQLTNTQNQLPTFPYFYEYYNPPAAGTTNAGTLFVGKLFLTDPAPFTTSYSGDLHLITIELRWTNYVGKTAVPHMRQMQTLSAKAGMQAYLSGSVSAN